MNAFFESDSISVEEGICSRVQDLFVFELLFLVEGSEFSLVVDKFLSVQFVIFFVLFDLQDQVGKVKILFFEPINNLYVIVLFAIGLILL